MSKKKSESAADSPLNYSHFNPTAEILAGELQRRIAVADLHTDLLKKEQMRLWLVIASELGLKVTRFDAICVGDTIWNTTVSEFTLLDRIIVDRRPTKRPTRFGRPVDCKEYWLQGQALERAQGLCSRALAAKSGEAA